MAQSGDEDKEYGHQTILIQKCQVADGWQLRRENLLECDSDEEQGDVERKTQRTASDGKAQMANEIVAIPQRRA